MTPRPNVKAVLKALSDKQLARDRMVVNYGWPLRSDFNDEYDIVYNACEIFRQMVFEIEYTDEERVERAFTDNEREAVMDYREKYGTDEDGDKDPMQSFVYRMFADGKASKKRIRQYILYITCGLSYLEYEGLWL